MSEADIQFPEGSMLDHFPLPQARPLQKTTLMEIEKAFRSGTRIVIVEAPVGSGKSAEAVAAARFFGEGHLITPRKMLQDQYFEDFSDMLVTMKGRNSYPCTNESTPAYYKRTIKLIKEGSIPKPDGHQANCSDAPCKGSKLVYQMCTSNLGPCPYTVAIETAQQSPVVVHNIHSFIFQTNYSEKFFKRKLLVVDEAHEIEDVLRGFSTKKFKTSAVINPGDIPELTNVDGWCDFFMRDQYVPEETPDETARRKAAEEAGDVYHTDRSRYLESVLKLGDAAEYFGEQFTVKRQVDMFNGRAISTSFEFIPHSIGTAAQRLLFDYGEYILLMSGTIYDKATFCRSIGLNPDDAFFIRVPSTFPIKNRPIYAKKSYQTDTSFSKWNENFDDMAAIMNNVLTKFHDVKGLIHSPSYESGMEMARFLPRDRVIVHDKSNFQEKLSEFYESTEPKVFISPICQQGVDFKYERARFQIVTRIPYLNTSDEFVKYMVENNFTWYNHQALVIFGQQIGRVNRADDDFGATFLLDSRFNKFIANNSHKLPQWLKNAIVY